MTDRRVLIVEDDPDIRQGRAELLTRSGYEVSAAGGVDEALALFRQAPVPVVVTDLRMDGEEDGLEVAREIRAINPDTKVIIVTATEHNKAAVDGYRVNVFAYVEKGMRKGQDSLQQAIDRAFEESQEHKVRRYMLSFLTHTMRNTFAGAGPALEDVLERSSVLAQRLDSDRQVYQMISDLAFLKTALSTVDAMLDAYKLLVREPENLRSAWQADDGTDASLHDVLDAALAASLSRVFCQEAQISTLKRIAAAQGVKEPRVLKQRFFADLLLAPAEKQASATNWIAAHIPQFVTVQGRQPKVGLGRSGLRFSLLFAIVSELCFNAFKYSDGRQPIQFRWKTNKGAYELTLINTFDRSRSTQIGSKEGRNFIRALLNSLDGIAVNYDGEEEQQGRFEAKLTVDKTFLKGETEP